MEFVWTLATVVMFVGLGLYGEHAWAEAHFQGAAPGALAGGGHRPAVRLELPLRRTGRQVGPDQAGAGERLDAETRWAWIRRIPTARTTWFRRSCTCPWGAKWRLLIRTQDVTHSFYVRELRLKQDAVPGMVIHMHFDATVPGQYEIACAELCGLGHYHMRSFLECGFAGGLR